MSFVKFKKLNHLSNMPATITNGCIYFVKDVNKIFVDFDSERQAYSISESDVATYTEAAVDESFADLLAKLEAIETTLNPEVKNNYQELLNNLKEIGQYSTTAEVQQMIANVQKKITKDYGTVTDGIIELDNKHSFYKISTAERTNFDIDITKIGTNFNVVEFELLVEVVGGNKPNFLFNPRTLDTLTNLLYNDKYTLLSVRGFRTTDGIMWTLENRGSWNS